MGTIAGEALKYKGLGYVYGGPAGRPGDWDCSSFVSYVLGHDMGLALPGGGHYGSPGYPPHSHGPVVTDYASWGGAKSVRSPRAGDLCCWVGAGTGGHIGIAISATRMISALDEALGTQVTPISGTGPSGVPLVFRRVTGAPGGAAVGGAGAAGPPRSALAAGALLGGILAAGSVAVVVAAAVLAGVVLALAGTAAAGALAAGKGTGAA